MMTRKLLLSILICSLLFTLSANGEETAPPSLGIKELPVSEQSRMFVGQTGRILPSGVIHFTLGGAFATIGGSDFLGVMAVGLGGIVELEMSTAQVITNIFASSTTIGTSALKFKIVDLNDTYMKPAVALSLRSNQWSSLSGYDSELRGPLASGDFYYISSVDFETHLTALALSSTFEFGDHFRTHLGVIWSEIRLRNMQMQVTQMYPPPPVRYTETFRKALVGGQGGIEFISNPQTRLMIEAGTLPNLKFSDDMKKISLEPILYGMGGVRFFFSQFSSVDAGLRYRSDYAGLSETEIRANFNLAIDVVNSVKQRRWIF